MKPELLTLAKPQLKKEALKFSPLPPGAVRKGSLAELSGPSGGGKTELTLQLLLENPSLRVAWIEDQFTLFPPALSRAGLSLKELLFIEAGKETPWTALQILRSQCFSLLVISSDRAWAEIELRRLQLAAERSECTVIFLRETALQAGAWPLSLQAEVKRQAGQPQIRIRRARGLSEVA